MPEAIFLLTVVCGNIKFFRHTKIPTESKFLETMCEHNQYTHRDFKWVSISWLIPEVLTYFYLLEVF